MVKREESLRWDPSAPPLPAPSCKERGPQGQVLGMEARPGHGLRLLHSQWEGPPGRLPCPQLSPCHFSCQGGLRGLCVSTAGRSPWECACSLGKGVLRVPGRVCPGAGWAKTMSSQAQPLPSGHCRPGGQTPVQEQVTGCPSGAPSRDVPMAEGSRTRGGQLQ